MGLGVFMVMGMVKYWMGMFIVFIVLVSGEWEELDDGGFGCWRGYICVVVDVVLGVGWWRMVYNIRGWDEV